MLTTPGELPEEQLRKVVEREPTPTGWAETTKYFYGENLVRQDCKIAVTIPFGVEGRIGKI